MPVYELVKLELALLFQARCFCRALIKDNCVIGTAVILYRGCSIGSECLIADLSTITNVRAIDGIHPLR